MPYATGLAAARRSGTPGYQNPPEELHLQRRPGIDVTPGRSLYRFSGKRRGCNTRHHHVPTYLPSGNQLDLVAEVATLERTEGRIGPQVVEFIRQVAVQIEGQVKRRYRGNIYPHAVRNPVRLRQQLVDGNALQPVVEATRLQRVEALGARGVGIIPAEPGTAIRDAMPLNRVSAFNRAPAPRRPTRSGSGR